MHLKHDCYLSKEPLLLLIETRSFFSFTSEYCISFLPVGQLSNDPWQVKSTRKLGSVFALLNAPWKPFRSLSCHEERSPALLLDRSWWVQFHLFKKKKKSDPDKFISASFRQCRLGQRPTARHTERDHLRGCKWWLTKAPPVWVFHRQEKLPEEKLL